MDNEKGDEPLGFLVRDAVASMDDSDQKPINVPSDSNSVSNERIMNAQKSDNFDWIHDKRAEVSMEGPGITDSEGVQESRDSDVDYIKWFSELNNTDVKFAGGKGASLGEMFSNKFPVPPGFVITAQSYDYFLKSAGLHDKIKEIIEDLDVENTEELNKASEKIRSLIENVSIPKELEDEIIESYHILSSEKIDEKGISEDALNILKNSQESIFVSVRSSATTEDLEDASFAGQQESFLNIKGDVDLLEHIKKCFSSLYTPRAIYYRRKKGFSGALIAVVVQKMIDSVKSGVVFSKDPIKQNDNIAIEAVFGLGEGIVSGRIQPDHYIVSKDLKVESVKVSNKKIAIVRTSGGANETVKLSEEKSKMQVLNNSEILEVADFAIKLEDHYSKPQDIEFAIENGEVFIIQSRPITTLGKKQEPGKELSGNVILEGLSASPGVGVGTVRIIHSMEELTKIKKGDVLVTEMTNPDMVVGMQKSVAIVTDEGGMTSHAAIVSREMGIPAIVGTGEATTVLKDGMKVSVDGFNGKVYEGEVAETTSIEIKKAVETERIKIKVIVDLPDFASRAAESGVDSVGLVRLEGIIASSTKHPLLYEKEGKLNEYTKLLEEGIKKIADHFKSVWIRASDIRTDEYSSLGGAPEREINPMLGFHGIRFSLKHPEILKAELNAIKEVAEYNPEKNFGIMFPQIISIEEVKEAKKYFNEIKTSNMEFGVMIETPAAVQIIDDICDEVDFISFGTNDLTQYTLAVDRGEEDVQYLYNELHPAIFSQIKKVIAACRSKKVQTSICGQAGSKKQMAEFLFKKGIDSISVNADAAAEISEFIKGMEDEWNKIENEKLEENILEAPKEETTKSPMHEEIEGRIKEAQEVKIDSWGNKAEIRSLLKDIMREELENKKDGELKEQKQVQTNDQTQEQNRVENRVENKVQTSEQSQEQIERRKKKKQEKFRKWKERKRQKIEQRKKEREQEKWDKKAQISSDNNTVIGEEKEKELVVQRKEEELVNDQKSEFKEDALLNKDDIEISAEKHEDENHDINVGVIEPIGDLDNIEDKAEKIQHEVKEDNKEDLEERQKLEDKIEVSSEIVEDNIKEKMEGDKKEEEVDEEEGGEKIEEKVENNEHENDEGNEDKVSSTPNEVEDKTSSIPLEGIEEIGVYNPDSEEKQEKQKYNYDFDDFE